MNETWVKPSGPYAGRFYLSNSAGASTAADSLPTIAIYRNAISTAVTGGSWTITCTTGPTTGQYILSGTAPAVGVFSYGDLLEIEATAIIGGVVAREKVDAVRWVPANVFDSLVLGTSTLVVNAENSVWEAEYVNHQTQDTLGNDLHYYVVVGLANMPSTTQFNARTLPNANYATASAVTTAQESLNTINSGSLNVNNVQGKVLGGGTGTITAQGVWAGNNSGADLATKTALESLQSAVSVIPTQPALAADWTPTRAAYLDAAITSRMATFTLPTNFATLSIDTNGVVRAWNENGNAVAGKAALETLQTTATGIAAKTVNLPAVPASQGDVTGTGTLVLAAVGSPMQANYNVATGAQAALVLSVLTTITDRIGAFAGVGVNTILGFFRVLFRKDLSVPSDVGGSFDPATDSIEAIRDSVFLATSYTAAPTAVEIANQVNTTLSSAHGAGNWAAVASIQINTSETSVSTNDG